MEHELHMFMVRVFAWIMGALLISAFFASYSGLWDESAVPILIGKTLLAFTGGMFVLAFVISRKVAKMLPSVAMATLVAYASFQGILFGLTYRAAYHASLAPVYTCMAVLFAILAVFGLRSGYDLSSTPSLLIGVALAPVLAAGLKRGFDVSITASCAACVCSWLMLALVGYHRQFLRDLPSSFDDDVHWNKAAAVGALQIYLDVVSIVLIVIQLRWLSELLQKDEVSSERSRTYMTMYVRRKN